MKRNIFSFQILLIVVVIIGGLGISFGQKRPGGFALRSISQFSGAPQIVAYVDKSNTAVFQATGFASGETVNLSIEDLSVSTDQPVIIGRWEVLADLNGSFGSAWYVIDPSGRYRVQALGESSAGFAEASFLGPEIILADGNLDQCANGAVGGVPVICTGTAWQNGNLNHNQAHYGEGEAVAYRITFSGMVIGSTNTVTIEWDTTEGGKHAIDYLTTFDESEAGADPCSGVPGCNLLVSDTYTIPTDANVTAGHDGIPGNADDIVQIPGVLTFFDAQILNVSSYTLTGSYAAGSQTSITITFRATSATPVLAWGGHIASRDDWGVNNSSIALTGSPFHMRVLDINGSGGNQDRSLSSSAAVFPAEVMIVKRVVNQDLTYSSTFVFGFTSSANFGMPGFTLVDNDPTELGGGGITNDQLVHFGAVNAITVTEDLITNGRYTLLDLSCTEIGAGVDPVINTTWNFATRTATIVPDEGEFITCTFVNSELRPTASTAAIDGRVIDKLGRGIRNGVIYLTPSDGGSETYRAITNPFGYYRFDEIPTGNVYVLTPIAKGYTFSPSSMIIMVNDNLSVLDIIGIRDP